MVLSIIIPLYNCKQYIRTCLDSILKQLPAAHICEIAVVDDGSTDDGASIVESFLNQYPNLRLIKQKHSGVSSARNRGFSETTGDYVWFIDSDDRLCQDCINEVLSVIEHEQPDMAKFGYRNVTTPEAGLDAPEGDFSYRVTHARDLEAEILSGHNAVWAYIFKREVIDKAELRFDESLNILEDQVFLMELTCNAQKALIINANIYRRYKRSDSATQNRNKTERRQYGIGTIRAAIAIKQFNERTKSSRSRIYYRATNEFCNLRAFFGLWAMVQSLCPNNDIDQQVMLLKQENLYPMHNFHFYECKGLRFTLALHVANHPLLLKLARGTFCCIDWFR